MNHRKRVGALTLAMLAGVATLAVPTAATADTGEHPALPVATTFAGDAGSCDMTPAEEYPVSSPEAVGLDSAGVKAAIDRFTSEGSEHVKVFRHGCLVAQSGLDPLTERVPRQNWSQTKTVNALIAGVAERKGLIDVDSPIGDYLPAGLGDAAHRAITVRSVLNMTTGLQMNWVRGLNFFADISRMRETMSTPIQHQPGEYFWYDQTTPSIMTYVVQQAIYKKSPGLDYQAWAQENFFDKLGIPTSAYWWQRDRAGNTLGFSQLFLRPLEFGRLGEVMLNNGVFGGQRLIDKSYMKQLQTGSKANCGNGFMVWTNGCKPGQSQVDAGLFKRTTYKGQPWISSAPSDMFLSFGYHGQHTFVIPSLDMVITRSGETAPDTVQNLPNDAALGSQIGAPFGQGYYTFFHQMMSAVTDMTKAQHARIANPSGTFDSSAPVLEVDMEDFNPMTAAPGTYFAVGPDAPQGCTFIGCDGERNDGPQWLTDVPRTFPGVLGMEQRPNG